MNNDHRNFFCLAYVPHLRRSSSWRFAPKLVTPFLTQTRRRRLSTLFVFLLRVSLHGVVLTRLFDCLTDWAECVWVWKTRLTRLLLLKHFSTACNFWVQLSCVFASLACRQTGPWLIIHFKQKKNYNEANTLETCKSRALSCNFFGKILMCD